MSLNKAIGGYFELEIAQKTIHYYKEAYRFQSARAAFYALLLQTQPLAVWMPRYICNSMLAPLKKAGIEVKFYSIQADFSIKDTIILDDKEFLLYVNYFGICSQQQHNILNSYNPNQIIFDNSQAFYASPLPCLATLYSPRKFFGLPDGGLLITMLNIEEPNQVDSASTDRCSHLLKRLDGHVESGYKDYQKAENTLEDFQPKRMSLLTEALMLSIDYEGIRLKRELNFNILSKHLNKFNRIDLDTIEPHGPLVYPYLSSEKELRSQMIGNRIFTPTYWPDIIDRVDTESVEYTFFESLISLPCDQRYSRSDLINVIDTLQKESLHEY